MKIVWIPILCLLCVAGFFNLAAYAQSSSSSNATSSGKDSSVTTSNANHRIDYIEFAATDIAATKQFYSAVFGWKFTDYGPDYVSFEDGRISGGFAKVPNMPGNGALVVIYASDLTKAQEAVIRSGGKITKEPFSFPGGRRFHFTDPNGNELSVWSEK